MFDEQPDGDIHGECSHEIAALDARVATLRLERDGILVMLEMILGAFYAHQKREGDDSMARVLDAAASMVSGLREAP